MNLQQNKFDSLFIVDPIRLRGIFLQKNNLTKVLSHHL